MGDNDGLPPDISPVKTDTVLSVRLIETSVNVLAESLTPSQVLPPAIEPAKGFKLEKNKNQNGEEPNSDNVKGLIPRPPSTPPLQLSKQPPLCEPVAVVKLARSPRWLHTTPSDYSPAPSPSFSPFGFKDMKMSSGSDPSLPTVPPQSLGEILGMNAMPMPYRGVSMLKNNKIYLSKRPPLHSPHPLISPTIEVDRMPYTCHECHKPFFNQSSLNKHLASHSDERPYRCTVCGKRFKRLDHLNNHSGTHKGARPYACSVADCLKKYSDPRSLRRHVGNTHPEQAYDYDILFPKRHKLDEDTDTDNREEPVNTPSSNSAANTSPYSLHNQGSSSTIDQNESKETICTPNLEPNTIDKMGQLQKKEWDGSGDGGDEGVYSTPIPICTTGAEEAPRRREESSMTEDSTNRDESSMREANSMGEESSRERDNREIGDGSEVEKSCKREERSKSRDSRRIKDKSKGEERYGKSEVERMTERKALDSRKGREQEQDIQMDLDTLSNMVAAGSTEGELGIKNADGDALVAADIPLIDHIESLLRATSRSSIIEAKRVTMETMTSEEISLALMEASGGEKRDRGGDGDVDRLGVVLNSADKLSLLRYVEERKVPSMLLDDPYIKGALDYVERLGQTGKELGIHQRTDKNDINNMNEYDDKYDKDAYYNNHIDIDDLHNTPSFTSHDPLHRRTSANALILQVVGHDLKGLGIDNTNTRSKPISNKGEEAQKGKGMPKQIGIEGLEGDLANEKGSEDTAKAVIRVGKQYQAEITDMIQRPCTKTLLKSELVWYPPHNLTDSLVDEYCLLGGSAVLSVPGPWSQEHALYVLMYKEYQLTAAIGMLMSSCDTSHDRWTKPHWSDEEKKLFEIGFQQYGKHFFRLQTLVKTKTVSQIIQYYYTWKKLENSKYRYFLSQLPKNPSVVTNDIRKRSRDALMGSKKTTSTK
eukprot:Ihof_evm3s482 gene=Ihof_evmTU3s482